jgi:hypothetical protein
MYNWLLENARSLVGRVPMVRNSQYQGNYADYWQFQGVDTQWRESYFRELESALFGQPPDLGSLLNTLYNTPSFVRKNGRPQHNLHFVFATKLLHTVNPNLPIYDTRTGCFYGFQLPSAQQQTASRIATCVDFYNWLIDEFTRVLNLGILANAMREFRQHQPPDSQQFSDHKVMDSLIWMFVDVQQRAGQLPYNPNIRRCSQCCWQRWP